LHRRIGEWAEAHWGRVNEDAAWLAGHFEQGVDWPRAIKYLQLAADTAGRLFGPRQAAGILEHALDLVDRLPAADRAEQEITILERLRTICIASLDSRAIETCETPGTTLLKTEAIVETLENRARCEPLRAQGISPNAISPLGA
jgi:hypothetical protein